MAGIVAIAACQKKDKTEVIPVEPSFVKPEASLDSFRNIVQAAPNGWEGTLTPQVGQIYRVYFQLDGTKQEVALYTDQTAATGTTASKSRFQISITQVINPTLSFSAGSHLDTLFINGKRIADTAYAFNYSKGDTLVLTGNRFGDKLTLVKATAEHKAAYTAGQLGTSIENINNYVSNTFFLSARPDNTAPSIFTMGIGSRNCLFTFLNAQSKLEVPGTDFSYSLTGLKLLHPLNVGGQMIDEVTWDTGKENLYITVNGAKVYLTEGIPPIPAHLLIGNNPRTPSLFSLAAPAVLPLPGWSPGFQTIWNQSASALKSGFNMTLYVVNFDMNLAAGTLSLTVFFRNSTAIYQGVYPYKITKTADGTYSFAALPLNTSIVTQSNANFIKAAMKPLTDLVGQNHFTLDYYDALSTYGEILAKVQCVEKPTVSFTGFFGSLIN